MLLVVVGGRLGIEGQVGFADLGWNDGGRTLVSGFLPSALGELGVDNLLEKILNINTLKK